MPRARRDRLAPRPTCRYREAFGPIRSPHRAERQREYSMRRTHDLGGAPAPGPINRSEHEYSMWEKRTDAMLRRLWERGILNVDEHRGAIESIDPGVYGTLSYYERWLVAL